MQETETISSVKREASQQLIHQNFEVFRSIIAQAKHFAQRNDFNMAALYGDMAAEYASFMQHCGLFVSSELEHLFLEIGHKVIHNSDYMKHMGAPEVMPKKVLHVTSHVAAIGGHSRLLWRWIQHDNERSHSVVLTQQRDYNIPKELRDAVSNTQGEIYALDGTVGDFIAQARHLHKIATSMDVVVLHTIFDASLPIIAFSNKKQSPPVIYVNHADERFWVGVSISDVVANLRESGMRLSEERRNIEKKRNALLPIVLTPTYRTHNREEAKRDLGFAEDSIVILSIARAVKYKTLDHTNFADTHVPLLKLYSRVILVIIGPGDDEDWSAAIQQTQGRIQVLGHTKNTDLYYQAADIYVDSFPFVSNTSLLEAGSYGLPLVSRYPYLSNACEIFGADMPGLTDNLIRAKDLEEYMAVLSNLIENQELRLTLGESTKRKIEETHVGSNWQQSLEALYAHAMTLPRVTAMPTLDDYAFTGEPDIFLQEVFPFQLDLDKLILDRVRLMPLHKRIAVWLKQLRRENLGRFGNIGFLLPEWLYRRLLRLENLYSRGFLDEKIGGTITANPTGLNIL